MIVQPLISPFNNCIGEQEGPVCIVGVNKFCSPCRLVDSQLIIMFGNSWSDWSGSTAYGYLLGEILLATLVKNT